MADLADKALFIREQTSYPFRICAKRADKKVKITKYSDKLTVYDFSDGSKLVATGRTIDFDVRRMDEQELMSLIAIESLFSDLRKPFQ